METYIIIALCFTCGYLIAKVRRLKKDLQSFEEETDELFNLMNDITRYQNQVIKENTQGLVKLHAEIKDIQQRRY